jgi:2-oxoglutarate/2-oxoacid ferredoxin oxidoreductase subunit alpha
MVNLRAQKIESIANYIPLQTVESGPEKGKFLILGWGSTYGAIKVAASELRSEGIEVSHLHLKYINPFPKNLGSLLKNFETILIPEMNKGQLLQLIRAKYLVDAKGLNKVKGIPFAVDEIKEGVKNFLSIEV